MIATNLAWFFGITTTLLWLLYKQADDRAATLDRRVKALQRRIALEAESRAHTEQRTARLETAFDHQQQRIALLVGQNEFMGQQLEERNRRAIHLLPRTGSTISRN
ncbi:MAG: hypothetical protein IT328_23975 [Caldilineaceae bacterium]|nr:hypothetical protein [Caldilineaceae bacterium]